VSRQRGDFIERTVHALDEAMERAGRIEDAPADGFFRGLDPRVKICGTLLLILAAVASKHIAVTAAIFALGAALALASGGPVLGMTARMWSGVLLFTGVIALPAIFLTPGAALWQIPWLGATITAPGLRSAAHLIVRTEATATLALMLALNTRWTHLLKALRVLGMPVIFVVILGMTHRYIFLLLQIAREFFEARRARLIGHLSGAQRRQLAASSAGALLGRSIHLGTEVHLAMQARGFRGNVYTLDEFRMAARDWCALGAFVFLAGSAFWMGAR
jgi:cobalt ECF transporter T component CbiQ